MCSALSLVGVRPVLAFESVAKTEEDWTVQIYGRIGPCFRFHLYCILRVGIKRQAMCPRSLLSPCHKQSGFLHLPDTTEQMYLRIYVGRSFVGLVLRVSWLIIYQIRVIRLRERLFGSHTESLHHRLFWWRRISSCRSSHGDFPPSHSHQGQCEVCFGTIPAGRYS